jgi:hypothetical protein
MEMNNRSVNVVVEKREELNSESRREEGIRWNDVCKCRRYV